MDVGAEVRASPTICHSGSAVNGLGFESGVSGIIERTSLPG